MVLQLYNLLACKVSCIVIFRFLLLQLHFRFLQDRQTKICDSNGGSDTSDFPPCPKCVKGPSKWYDKQLNVVADTYTDVYCRVRKYLINGECNRFQLIAAQCTAFLNLYLLQPAACRMLFNNQLCNQFLKQSLVAGRSSCPYIAS